MPAWERWRRLPVVLLAPSAAGRLPSESSASTCSSPRAGTAPVLHTPPEGGLEVGEPAEPSGVLKTLQKGWKWARNRCGESLGFQIWEGLFKKLPGRVHPFAVCPHSPEPWTLAKEPLAQTHQREIAPPASFTSRASVPRISVGRADGDPLLPEDP